MAELVESVAEDFADRRTPGTQHQNTYRRFPNVASYVETLGGKRPITKILIANNGVAAVKAIRYIRRWAYDVFGDERAIQFVVMATPEDLRANAEYIRLGDHIVDVPGGSNNHNYANVTLITELARLHGVHAVWAGWGHASENPVLPDTLAASQIAFVGPAGAPMRALGDKIGSTILAQCAGVPCMPWNGVDIKLDAYENLEAAVENAGVESATAAESAAERIGFPVMIKASEGGGGKGIRRVDRSEDVADAYRQVCGEVPGSPIFIMQLCTQARHLEVQLLADEYGNAVALNGRDCSVQRRHQKIIEEGPPVAADPDVWTEMEKAAVALAKAVGYANAGTVEYLYSECDAKFYFLELNPRLQVEHPVTEMITRVNLPAAQLQVAMGIPLDNIPDIRELYGRNRFEEEPDAPESRIDLATAERVKPAGHCMAVRITAENAEAGFKPTSGGIQELNFRSTPNVWGYFSMDSSGSIHEFADSQFGHLFANGANREQARRNMVLALKELSIRGDISTTVDFISRLIELEDFVSNKIDTAWLDGIIKENVEGMGAAEGLVNRPTDVKISTLSDHIYIVLGATIRVFDICSAGEKRFVELLDKGQLPPRSLLKMSHAVELILNGMKYRLDCTRNGPKSFSIAASGGDGSNEISTNVRVLSDGGYLIDVGGTSFVAYVTSKGDAATGMKINVSGKTVVFSPDYDPTALRTDVAGKLVKKLKQDGARVKKGEPYCEIEVMKMFMPLKVEESGTLSWGANEGAAISAGDLLATLELDNPENVSMVQSFEGSLLVPGSSSTASNIEARPHLLLRQSIDTLSQAMSGYVLSADAIESALANLALAVTQPTLPIYDVQEKLSVLSGRIPGSLYDQVSSTLDEFNKSCKQKIGSGVELRFPAGELLKMLDSHAASIVNSGEKLNFGSLTAPLRDSVLPYTRSNFAGVPGAEFVLQSFLSILRQWISVERWFSEWKSHADAMENLRRSHKDDTTSVLNISKAHEQLPATSEIVIRIISVIGDGTRIDFKTGATAAIGKRLSIVAGAESLPLAMPVVAEIGAMGSTDDYSEVALRARKLLMQESMPSLEQRRQKLLKAASSLSTATSTHLPRDAEALIADRIPLSDIILPLLSSAEGKTKETGLLELYFRNLYSTYSLREFERNNPQRSVKFSFFNKPSESALHAGMSVTSMTDLTKMVRSGSLGYLSDSSERSETTFPVPKIPQSILRTGVGAILQKFENLEDEATIDNLLSSFPQYEGGGQRCDAGPVNVLYLIVLEDAIGLDEQSSDDFALRCEDYLRRFKAKFDKAYVRRVSFVLPQEHQDEFTDVVPALFTFRSPDFTEDSLYRRIDPGSATNLQLDRVSANFKIQSLGSRHTATCHAHLYQGVPRPGALSKDTKANKMPRIFARALSSMLEFTSSGFERILVDVLNALDLCPLKSRSDNHIFVNLVSDFEGTVLDPIVVEQVVVEVLKRHSERVSALGVVEVETRIVCSLEANSPPIAIRLFGSNPTGYVQVLNTYVEALPIDGTRTDRVFELISGTKASLASAGDSSWHQVKTSTPYPLTRPFDAQRKAALQSSDTIYCYDLPALFEAAVEKQWVESSRKGSVDGPLMVMYTTELVVQKKGGAPSDHWTMKDYLKGDLELMNVERKAGLNDVGMVAWLIELKTVEYSNGRHVVLIANDITHKAGSFGTREDVVFKLASEYARKKRIPRIFIAANSGARIGLADSVKQKFRVAFKGAKPEQGFNFLYLKHDEYQELTATNKEVLCEQVELDGEMVYKIKDIIGSEPDLGVENLKGSGLIAGETSAAYDDIFTMTIVLGRTVGIGAYLVRLGQRTIQKTCASPIILTGYQALNKLMGTDVYSTNDQLGGPGIMYPNGISHIVEPDHLRAVKAAVDWLRFVPSVRGGLLPISDIRGVDELERTIDFTPQKGVPYDPRHLLAGAENDSGEWQSGFFDRGSFHESLAGWAKTVVVGRARLGGIPMGVVITENRTAEAIKPADPADVKASEAVIQEAGCVWFPNSAYKTAQAIKDFNTEDLPLIVFANWRGFSGGQRDMFDEVLKYGSLIVDAFVAYEHPVFVFIPPHAEIRGGAWVVLDASINSKVMEMYAAKDTARGGVLEANGAASVKYRSKDLISTMHRLDDQLKVFDETLLNTEDEKKRSDIAEDIKAREQMLLPVYEQIAVQFCELHDTPGRMKAVGVIEKEVDWKEARSFFYWRLRRKLAEFDLRKQILEAGQVGRGVECVDSIGATELVKSWFLESPSTTEAMWADDRLVLSWMAKHHKDLEQKIVSYTQDVVAREVFQVLVAEGNTRRIGLAGIVQGISNALEQLPAERSAETRKMLASILETTK